MTRPTVNLLFSLLLPALLLPASAQPRPEGDTAQPASPAPVAPMATPPSLAEGSSKELRAYALFDDTGRELTFGELIDRLTPIDAVFVGEIHNCPIAHWLEFEIARSLHARHGERLVLGAEMFESDTQPILDEYMRHLITADRFEAEARLWGNYATDYRPLVDFAKEHSIPFVATNVPRRYASSVRHHGLGILDSLTAEARRHIAPLPIAFAYDEARSQAAFGMMSMMGHGTDTRRLAEAQALKDATMAWFIARNLSGKFLHINGNFHTDFKGGIIPYLEQYRPGTRIATIATLRQPAIDRLSEDQYGRADFYICVPETMPNSY